MPFQALLDKLTRVRAPQMQAPRPDTPFAVIGDVHGRLDLLKKLLVKLPPELPVICVGDYIDRGPASIDTLHFLEARSDITCLKGNHEDMLLDFLDHPETKGPRWVRNGGLQTMAELGITGLTEMSRGAKLREARDVVAGRIGPQTTDWLRRLPLIRWSGNVAVVHAGTDPRRPLEENSARTLLWGHPDFLKKPRRDGWWVVHGHTIVDEPSAADGRIAVDTGAFATGCLTAAIITKGDVRFVTA